MGYQRTSFQRHIHRLSTEIFIHARLLLDSSINIQNVVNVLINIDNIFFNFPLLYVDNSPVQGYHAPTARQKCPADKKIGTIHYFFERLGVQLSSRGSLCRMRCGKSVLIVCETNCLRNSSIPGLDHYRQALTIICSHCLRQTGLSRTLSRINILSEYASLCGSFSRTIHWLLHWRLALS